ncbi:hypothetical protein ARMGADRAFT_1038038 [Armillaria gallica]|uniref:Uncharacterized protein n=1 Tax=Armillaria gallica TaxID=47427 RepID=A0A2H3CJI3_ARMGA|nr:hypothetical protein ARMGADRAFT_1038038 [Armillaria gallica]
MAENSPIPDANINPALRFLHLPQPDLSEDTPSDNEELPPAGTIRQTDDDHSDPNNTIFSGPVGPMVANLLITDLTPFGQFLKANMELSDESELKLDHFCSPHPHEERLAMLYAMILSNQDLLRGMRKTASKNWEISMELQHTMRELQVQGLPPDNEPSRVTQVLSKIQAKLTQFRSVLKEKVMQSQTSKGTNFKNIGDLAGVLIKNTKIPRTQELYMRLAFLRFLLSSESGINLTDEEKFWVNVDNTLEHSLNHCYVEDKKKYGEPLGEGHQTLHLDNAAPWIKTINKNAKSVPKGASITGSRKQLREE